MVEQTPAAPVVIRIVGAAFLLAYGVFATVRAFKPKALVANASPVPISTRAAVATMIALTWLNPHVYLDTLVFPGSVAHQQGEAARWWWGRAGVGGPRNSQADPSEDEGPVHEQERHKNAPDEKARE